MDQIRKLLPFLNNQLLASISENSSIVDVPKGTELLRADQYVKVLPVVLEGLVKVSSRFDDRELLLYYIKPAESCAMSFSAVIKNKPSLVTAVAEEDSTLALLPVDKIPVWIRDYPDFNQLFYEQYDLRYTELLDTIQHILLNKMDKRLYDYLKQKSELRHDELIKLSHSQIANELGTVREVISRVIKKLESDGSITQTSNGIKFNGL